MIKTEIRSLFKNLLPRFDKSGKYHPRFVDAAIEKVIAEMYTDVLKRNPDELQKYCKPYGYTTPLTVSFEAATDTYYTTLPAAILPFPDDASGVRRITTPTQKGLTFFAMNQGDMDWIQAGSHVDIVTGKVGYCVTPTRVEYYNMSGVIIASGVKMDCIVPFSVYLDTDTVLIPEEKDAEGKTFIDKVLAVLGVVVPIDALDNNADLEKTTKTQ